MAAAADWRDAFLQVVSKQEHAEPLKQAATQGKLAAWTRALTTCTVETCGGLGWQASAIGHKATLLPVNQSEYLALDVMAFGDSEQRWRFPVAVMELENSQAVDRIAYSLWKVLLVRAGLRVVFCYRRNPNDAPQLIRALEQQVVQAMGLAGRVGLEGETLVVVGRTGEAEVFPYGFFQWWQLDAGTGKFGLMA